MAFVTAKPVAGREDFRGTLGWPLDAGPLIGRSRDLLEGGDGAAPLPDVAAELKRLRRKIEVLRHERDILKKATAFFVREGSR